MKRDAALPPPPWASECSHSPIGAWAALDDHGRLNTSCVEIIVIIENAIFKCYHPSIFLGHPCIPARAALDDHGHDGGDDDGDEHVLRHVPERRHIDAPDQHQTQGPGGVPFLRPHETWPPRGKRCRVTSLNGTVVNEISKKIFWKSKIELLFFEVVEDVKTP